MTSRKWFPDAREARHAMITKTAAFMAVENNRTAIGFASQTPYGMWYDTDYVPPQTAYLSAYQTWDNPATGTQLAFDNLKDAEKAFFPVYREFYGMVKSSVLVSDASLEAMDFPPRPAGGHTPHPVDKYFIDLIVKPLGNLVLSVAFVNRDTGKSIIPYFLTGAVIYYAVSDTPVTNQNDLTFSRLASRSPFELIFSPEDRGKTVYLAARWQNRRGELGPWSEIVEVIIP
ncbi:MAG: hypothetical protein LBL42_06625 [Tannerella sp.]|jgi:hypothetical protein|nr:hypothetical protein [Tannerella sp.]